MLSFSRFSDALLDSEHSRLCLLSQAIQTQYLCLNQGFTNDQYLISPFQPSHGNLSMVQLLLTLTHRLDFRLLGSPWAATWLVPSPPLGPWANAVEPTSLMFPAPKSPPLISLYCFTLLCNTEQICHSSDDGN